MPSTNGSSQRSPIPTQRNLTIVAAILIAVPTAYAFRAFVGGEFAGGFLLLLTLAVGVPRAYDEYWPAYDRTWKAIAWIVVASAAATVEFVGLYLVGTNLVGLSPLLASIGAFLVTDLATLTWLLSRRR